MLRKGILGLIALAFASPALAKSGTVMPYPVRGIWMDDSTEGRRQCRDYLAALRKPNGDVSVPLVGSEVVSARKLHSYAEYGEGNVYEPRRITPLGKQKWRIHAALGIDGEPEEGAAGRAVFTLAIEGRKLLIQMESVGGKPTSSESPQRFFRCAAVPPGMYGG